MILQDSRLKLAAGITVVMTIVILIIAQGVDSDRRFVILLSLIGLMALVQMTVLFWGGLKRRAFTIAQHHYIKGEFEEAAQLLETSLQNAHQTPDARSLALLGNTYRQLGQLGQSEERLRAAVDIAPQDDMALYGLGRTLLARGVYDEAAQYIESALDNGARKPVRADLALALYYADSDPERLLDMVRRAARLLNLEEYRLLWVNYLVHQLIDDEQEQTLALRIIAHNAGGLAYWQSQARHYADTDYGKRMAADVLAIKAILDSADA